MLQLFYIYIYFYFYRFENNIFVFTPRFHKGATEPAPARLLPAPRGGLLPQTGTRVPLLGEEEVGTAQGGGPHTLPETGGDFGTTYIDRKY